MQAEIEKICGYVFPVGPFSGSVGNDERNVVLAQHLDKGFVDETFVPDLDSVPNGAGGIDGQPCATCHAVLTTASKTQRLLGIVRQKLKKKFHSFGIIAKAWRELPEDRPEFFSKIE